MALYFYQNFSRIRYRVSYTFLLPAILFLLFAYSREHLQVRFRDIKTFLKAIYGVVAVGASAAVIFYANSVYLSSVQRSVGNSIVAAFHVYNSDSLTDFVDSFIVRLIPSGNGYKVTEYADGGNDYLARFYVISTYDSFR